MRAGQDLPPTAPLLMNSLRALGYTTAAALADLVDNSIAADAHRIAITFRPVPMPFWSSWMMDAAWTKSSWLRPCVSEAGTHGNRAKAWTLVVSGLV